MLESAERLLDPLPVNPVANLAHHLRALLLFWPNLAGPDLATATPMRDEEGRQYPRWFA